MPSGNSGATRVDTLMSQDVPAEPEWAGPLIPSDLRGLTRCSGSTCAPATVGAPYVVVL